MPFQFPISSSSSIQSIQLSNFGTSGLPGFCKENPTVWFRRIEATFRIVEIHLDKDKFNCIVQALNTETPEKVKEIIMCPPAVGMRYYALKTVLESQRSGVKYVRMLAKNSNNESHRDPGRTSYGNGRPRS